MKAKMITGRRQVTLYSNLGVQWRMEKQTALLALADT